MRKMILIFGAVLALLTSLANASPALATGFLGLPVPPPTDRIVIDVVTVNGSGCPSGTAAVAVSPDNTAFTVTYSNYMAQVGPGVPSIDLRKNCQINLVVHVPQGFTYAIAQADYRGFANLGAGATGTERANYYFQGQSATAFQVHTFNALQDDWQTTDTTDLAALIYAPCGALRNFNINTELRVTGGTDHTFTNFMSMDSTDGAINTTYQFHWERCPH
jgi:hypothetical protein